MDTPTIYDVSRLSGVSTATVSRTFTTPDRVRESTRRRVLRRGGGTALPTQRHRPGHGPPANGQDRLPDL